MDHAGTGRGAWRRITVALALSHDDSRRLAREVVDTTWADAAGTDSIFTFHTVGDDVVMRIGVPHHQVEVLDAIEERVANR